MKIVSSMTPLLLVRLCCVQAIGTSGRMTRQRFQASVHTLIDDEMALLSDSSNMMEVGDESGGSSTASLHRRIKSAAPKNLRGHPEETFHNASVDIMDDLFDSIISHGWDHILSSTTNEEDRNDLFLVCHESHPSLGLDRMQVIRQTFDMSSHAFYESIHSTVDDLCVIASISTAAASKYNSTELTLAPWIDIMKMTPGILEQLVSDDASNTALSRPVVFSIAQNDRNVAEHVVSDVIVMANSKQVRSGQHEQQRSLRSLHEAFSLTKTMKSASSVYWSRMLAGDSDCSSMLDELAVTPLTNELVFQLNIGSSNATEVCLAALLVSLAVHPAVVRVGTIEENVEIHNLQANWVVQGRATDVSGNEMLPFTAAGLDGRSQLISISDTGLDVNNCYFVSSTSDSDPDSIFDHVSEQ